MRVFEVVDRHAAGVQRVLDRTGSDELVEHLRLPAGVDALRGDDADVARSGDLLVLLLTPDFPGDRLTAAATAVPEGGVLLLLLTHPLPDLPVGPVVGALSAEGLQVVEASPVAHTTVTAAVVARRSSDKLLPFVPYLGERPLTDPDDAQVRRLLNEHLVEGLVVRAHEAERESLLEATRAANAALEDMAGRLEREAVRAQTLETSRTMAVGRAVSEVRRHPVRGLWRLPGALRAARRPSRQG